MRNFHNFAGPDKGFEDYEMLKSFAKTSYSKASKKTQGSQTFFRIKNSSIPTNRQTSTHFRTKTMNSNREEPKKEEISIDNNKNELFEIKRSINLDDFMTEHEIKMKNIESLGKIKRRLTEYRESEEKIMSSVIVSCLLKGIKILANFEFEYKELISMYPSMFQTALYINSEILEEYKDLIENMEHERIRNYVKMNRIEKCPYTVFCGCLLEEHKYKTNEFKSIIDNLIQKNQDLTDLNKQNNQLMQTLNEKIDKMKHEEMNSPHSTKLQQMHLEVAKLENENIELKGNMEVLSLKAFSMDSEIYEYKSRLEFLQTSNSQYEEKVEALTAEKEKIIRDYENKISNFKAFKIQAADLKNTLDKIIIKMSSIKTHFLKTQQEKSDLMQERHDLVIRAAAGFENLTPRPNFTHLCSEKNLQLAHLLPKTDKKKKTTSVFIVDGLLSKICEYQAKIALMDSELKDRKRGLAQLTSNSNLKKPSVSQIAGKASFNARNMGSISSPMKTNSKMISMDSIEKKSKFLGIITTNEEEVKSSKDSNYIDSPNKSGIFDFKSVGKKEEEGEEEENIDIIISNNNENNGEMINPGEKEIKETEQIIEDIIQSKKLIELFEMTK